MNSKQQVLLFLAALVVAAMFLFILFGEQGLADLNMLKRERDNLVESTRDLAWENLALLDEIERLKNDPDYIEHIAREELGMIGKDEFIIKIKK